MIFRQHIWRQSKTGTPYMAVAICFNGLFGQPLGRFWLAPATILHGHNFPTYLYLMLMVAGWIPMALMILVLVTLKQLPTREQTVNVAENS